MSEGVPANGGDLIAEVLRAHAVPCIHTLCGGHISPILSAAKARGIRIVGASSDHLITETDRRLHAGTEIGFRPGYGAFMRAMTSRSVATVLTGDGHRRR